MRASPWRLPTFRRFLLLALAAGVFVPSGFGQGEGGDKVYQNLVKSTAWVLVPGRGSSLSTGTATLIDRSKRILVTNFHVVGESDEVLTFFPQYQKGKVVADRKAYFEVFKSGGGVPGRVVQRDEQRDLALIQLQSVPENAIEIKLARDSASPGQRVHSVGNPGGSGALWVYTSGTVRTQPYQKKWRAASGRNLYNFDAQILETQSPTNPGDSGGPLVNDRGELVAVTQGSVNDGQLLSLFVDISEVKTILKSKGLVAKLAAASKSASEAEKPGNEKPSVPEKEKTEQLASTKLTLAKTLAAEGKPEAARTRYRDIVKSFPGTEAAKEAKQLLEMPDK